MEKTQTLPSLKRGDAGYVLIKGQHFHFTIVAIHEELSGTLTVANAVSKWTCRKDEFIPDEQFKKLKLQSEEPEARQRLAPILEAWEAGHTNANAICKFLADKQVPIHILAIRAKMLECHRRGFLQLPIVDGKPSAK